MNSLLGPWIAILTLTVLAPHSFADNDAKAEAARDMAVADSQLNAIYRELLAALKPEEVAQLKTAQRSWLIQRDAEAQLRAGIAADGGSIYTVFNLANRTELTYKRTEELKDLLKWVRKVRS